MTSVKRMKGLAISRPIIYGNSAAPIQGKKPDSNHTHRWTVSVRGVNNEDISYFVRKVSFKLHDTYDNPNRVIDAPPFEVTETGWGEFDIVIKVFFHPSSGEKPLTLYHHLKLHPYENDEAGNPWPKSKPVTSFNYEEVVFTEPVDQFYHLLNDNSTSNIPLKKSPQNQFSLQMEQEEVEKLDTALKATTQEIIKFRERCKRLEAELADVGQLYSALLGHPKDNLTKEATNMIQEFEVRNGKNLDRQSIEAKQIKSLKQDTLTLNQNRIDIGRGLDATLLKATETATTMTEISMRIGEARKALREKPNPTTDIKIAFEKELEQAKQDFDQEMEAKHADVIRQYVGIFARE